jgi:hypothetical protein
MATRLFLTCVSFRFVGLVPWTLLHILGVHPKVSVICQGCLLEPRASKQRPGNPISAALGSSTKGEGTGRVDGVRASTALPVGLHVCLAVGSP